MSNTCLPSSLRIVLYFAVENGHLAGQTGSKLEKAAMFLTQGIQHHDQAEISDALCHQHCQVERLLRAERVYLCWLRVPSVLNRAIERQWAARTRRLMVSRETPYSVATLR